MYDKAFMGGIQSGEKKPAVWKIIILCAVSGILNATISYFVNGLGHIPLYLDTLFTVAMCFSAGLLPGIFTALLLPLLTTFKYTYLLGLPAETAWWIYLFVLCVFCEVVLVFSFRKRIMPLDAAFRKTSSLYAFIGLAPLLLVIVALDCLVVSVSGGIIDFVLTLLSSPKAFFPEDTFKLGLLRNNVPVLASAVLSRIPINIVDRFIVIFGGYAVSLLYRKWLNAPSR